MTTTNPASTPSTTTPNPSTTTTTTPTMSAPNPKEAQWLGQDSLAAARSSDDVYGIRMAITKHDRASLAPKELQKVQDTCQKGITPVFTMMKLSDQAEKTNIKGVYDVQTRLNELEKSIKDCDMHDVFTIASAFEKNADDIFVPTSTATELNLFTNYTDIDLQTVKHWNAYCLYYGATYKAQNLTWGMEKILNSCDVYLRTKILESINKYDVMHRYCRV